MKRKHQPSGIMITWFGVDNKIHTQSIPKNSMELHLMTPELYAESQLLCLQLDSMTLGEGVTCEPQITVGIDREQARLAFQKRFTQIT